jgi:AcrR family transcriptional regulator
VPRRKYDQRLRAESAAQTRRRILDAVGSRLRDAPTETVSMDKVADLAGVSRSTIYVVFGSRSGLFDAFTMDLVDRTGMPELARAVTADDPREHLRGSVLAACRMLAADLEIYRVLSSMSRMDPDAVGGAMQRMGERRRGGLEYLARRLADAAILRDDVTVERAVDLLWTLSSIEALDQLITDRGMSADDAADLLATTAERALYR